MTRLVCDHVIFKNNCQVYSIYKDYIKRKSLNGNHSLDDFI